MATANSNATAATTTATTNSTIVPTSSSSGGNVGCGVGSSQPPASNVGKSRFPRLQECAHFHYEVSTVDLPKNFKVVMVDAASSSVGFDPSSSSSSSIATTDLTTTNTHNKPNVNVNTTSNSTTSTSSSTSYNPPSSTSAEAHLFHLQVTANEKRWIIYRSYENFRYLDKYLHDCIFDRKFSCLEELTPIESTNNKSSSKKGANSDLIKQLRTTLASYLTRFSEIAFVNPINCGPILNWFEIDNRGNRMLAIDDSPINIPGVAAAMVKKRYVAQSLDELSLDVGNMISVIDMPPSDESVWWRGKKELEVGFFPADCVELIKCNQMHLLSNQDHLPKMNQNQSVRLKHGKLITLLRSFFNTRPARNHLQSKGIIKQRVFACDLGEHLSNTQQDVPKILSICTQFIEQHGIVDGIYRHTGLQSNIQKLRNAFDEEKFSEIEQEIYINDVHSVSSLLKMYFRELPNPLLTYQLYHKFIRSINVEDKIIEIHDVVQQLPPPHYRTLAFLMKHLHKLAEFSAETNMNTKNLAIVWAPNLLKSREMDSKDSMQFDMLHSITLQANITEFLIANADTIFNDKFASLVRKTDVKNNIAKTYRPISICYNNGPAKLLSLEEAQDKYKQVGPSELPKYHTVIEIPELKKKKPKEKDKEKKASSNSTAASIPANIQIQQQFEMLQQNQLSKTPPSQIPNSLSSQSVVSQSAPSTVAAAASIMTASTISQPPPTGSSSPAPFKSLFRNLRVGSLKHQSPNNHHHNHQQSPVTTSHYPHPQSNSQSSEASNNPSLSYKYINNEQATSPIKMSRTASTSQTGATAATFKPVSSTLGITMTSNSDASSSSGVVKSELYSNCITQLQSTHNAMREAQNLASFTGSLSPITTVGTTIAPILVRTSKLNQSQSSIHSNIHNIHMNGAQKQMTMSTFSPSTVSHTAVNNVVNDSKNGNLIGCESSTNQTPINPVPCKRRTTIQQSQNIPQSNSSVTLNHQQEQQQSSSGGGSIIIQETITPNNPVEVKRRGGVGFSLGSSGDHEYTDIVIDQQQSQTKQQQQQQSPLAHHSRKSANEDDMQRLVAYINQFEQDSNSNIIQATIKSEPHLITLSGVGNGTSMCDKAAAASVSLSQTVSPPPPPPPTSQSVQSEDITTAAAAATSSKLRLSSSSLSSSTSDDDMEGDDDEDGGEWLGDEHTSKEATTRKNGPFDNEYEELEIDHPSKKRDDIVIKRDQVDRRTYIVNKLYDNLGDEHNSTKSDRERSIPQVFPMEENDDQYEKVIIDKNKPKSGVISSVVVEDGEYDNDLIVNDSNLAEVDEKNVIMVVNRPMTDTTGTNTLSSAGTNYTSKDTEHIYMNVSGVAKITSNHQDPSTSSSSIVANSEPTAAIRESLGFDVTEIVGDENIYENGVNVAGEEEEKFDSELVELNQQIKNLLTAPSSSSIGDGGNLEPNQQFRTTNHQKVSTFVHESAQHSTVADSFRSTQSSSISNDNLVKKKEDSVNKHEDNEVPVQKRKSTAGFDELKRRRSVEQQAAEETRFVPERTKTVSIGIVPKTRQTISLASVETTNPPTTTTTNNSNPSFTKRNTNLKSTSNRSMSKSLQDNSKIFKQPQQQQINLTSSQTCQLDGNQPGEGAKLVLIETRDNNQSDNSTTSQSTSKTVSVKSKIKLMESIVQNRTVTKSSERSSSTSSSTSSSSSSSASSSRSPPISPKNNHPVVVQPVVKTRTSHQKSMAPPPPLDATVSNGKVKISGEMSVSTEEEPTSSSTMADEEEANTTNLPLTNLKEKRRTVKELMSKFEPK